MGGNEKKEKEERKKNPICKIIFPGTRWSGRRNAISKIEERKKEKKGTDNNIFRQENQFDVFSGKN